LQALVKTLTEKAAKIDALEREVQSLRTQVRLITNAPNAGGSNIDSAAAPSNVQPAPVGSKKTYPATLGKASAGLTVPTGGYTGLGKHSRESSTDSSQAGSSNSAAHDSKRKKLGDKTALFRPDTDEGEANPLRGATSEGAPAGRQVPSFKVYEGPEESDEPSQLAVAAVPAGNANSNENVVGVSSQSTSSADNGWAAASSHLTAMLAPPVTTTSASQSAETPVGSNPTYNFLGTSPWTGFGGPSGSQRQTTPPMDPRDAARLGLPMMHDPESPSDRALKVVHRVDGVDMSFDPEDVHTGFWHGVPRAAS
jgi:hypothetical protein